MKTKEPLRQIRGDNETQLVVPRLSDHADYSAAVRKLAELTAGCEAHRKQKEIIKSNTPRYDKSAKDYVRHEMAFWNLGSAEIDVHAKILIRTGQLPADINEPSPLALKYPEEGRDAILRFDFERKCIEIFGAAVEIQKKNVATLKREAIAEICSILRPKYDSISRNLSQAVLNLCAALEEHRAFYGEFISEDPELSQGLTPTPFCPEGIFSDRDFDVWIGRAIEAKLFDPQDKRARLLGLAITREATA